MRGKYASCLRTANCFQRGLKELKSSGEWKRWLAYKFRDLIAILPRPGHHGDKAQTPGTVGNYAYDVINDLHARVKRKKRGSKRGHLTCATREALREVGKRKREGTIMRGAGWRHAGCISSIYVG